MTGMVIASSTSDCPRFLRAGAAAGLTTSVLDMELVSVGLRLQPHVILRRQAEGCGRDQRPGLPLVLVLDGHAHEIAGPVGHVARGGVPWFRAEQRGAEEVVLVHTAAAAAACGIDRQVSSVRILDQAID